jgi:hypothetical protein
VRQADIPRGADPPSRGSAGRGDRAQGRRAGSAPPGAAGARLAPLRGGGGRPPAPAATPAPAPAPAPAPEQVARERAWNTALGPDASALGFRGDAALHAKMVNGSSSERAPGAAEGVGGAPAAEHLRASVAPHVALEVAALQVPACPAAPAWVCWGPRLRLCDNSHPPTFSPLLMRALCLTIKR